MTDFIQITPNVFTAEECESIAAYFDMAKALGYTQNRQQFSKHNPLEKDDSLVKLEQGEVLRLDGLVEVIQAIMPRLWECYNKYIERFPGLGEYQVRCLHQWLQRTEQGQGYHLWHYENGGTLSANRCVVFTVYLSEVAEGGETEFIYQHRRVAPQKGSVMLFPAGFTHTHRGNPVISPDVKYILTGWFEYC